MDRQPTLTGDRLLLRPLRASDWVELFAAASDPKIWEQHPESERWTETVFRRFFEEALAGGGALAIVERATGQLVGSSRYHGHDATAREVEIGWTFLIRRLWGGSYNREVKSLMLAHAFMFVDRVLFLVDEKNVRSRRAMEKLGGKVARSFPRDGRTVVVYAIRRAAR